MADFHLPEHEVHAVADEAEELVEYRILLHGFADFALPLAPLEAVDSPEEKSGKDA